MHKIKLLLLVNVLIISSQIKAQENNLKDKADVYFHSDTIDCTFTNGYIFNYIQIEYTDKKIEAKLNAFFLFYDFIDEETNINNIEILYQKNKYRSMLDQVKDSISIICERKENISLLDHYIKIGINKYHILSVRNNWCANGYPTGSSSYFNLNMQDGSIFKINDILKKEKKQDVINLIKNRIENNLTTTLNSYKKYSNTDLEQYLSCLDDYKKEYKDYNLNIFFIQKNSDNNREGIQFIFSYNYPQTLMFLQPSFDLFFSFEELKPYLTEEFKNRIFGKDLE